MLCSLFLSIFHSGINKWEKKKQNINDHIRDRRVSIFTHSMCCYEVRKTMHVIKIFLSFNFFLFSYFLSLLVTVCVCILLRWSHKRSLSLESFSFLQANIMFPVTRFTICAIPYGSSSSLWHNACRKLPYTHTLIRHRLFDRYSFILKMTNINK